MSVADVVTALHAIGNGHYVDPDTLLDSVAAVRRQRFISARLLAKQLASLERDGVVCSRADGSVTLRRRSRRLRPSKPPVRTRKRNRSPPTEHALRRRVCREPRPRVRSPTFAAGQTRAVTTSTSTAPENSASDSYESDGHNDDDDDDDDDGAPTPLATAPMSSADTGPTALPDFVMRMFAVRCGERARWLSRPIGSVDAAWDPLPRKVSVLVEQAYQEFARQRGRQTVTIDARYGLDAANRHLFDVFRLEWRAINADGVVTEYRNLRRKIFRLH